MQDKEWKENSGACYLEGKSHRYFGEVQFVL